MKGMRGMVVILILTVILVGWVGVYASEAKPGCPLQGFGKHGGMFRQILARLDLTEAQERDIANVLKQHREEIAGVRTQMIEARKAQFSAMTATPFNKDAVRAAAAKAAEIEVQLTVNRAKVFDEIRQLLTAEQQVTFQQLANEFASRRHKGFEHHGRMLDRWIEDHSDL